MLVLFDNFYMEFVKKTVKIQKLLLKKILDDLIFFQSSFDEKYL